IPSPTPEELNGAWEDALTLMRKLGGNAAYLTFGASKVPMDAASGQIAAGMCIDYYGRSQAEWEEEHVGRRTIIYRTPQGGSSVSADPIGILRGAENRKLAEEFIDYVMSPEGQRLWGCRKGLPGGPEKYNLFRLPVRRDLYTQDLMKDYCFPKDENPFVMAEQFIYQGAWTARLFSLMRVLVKVMIIDCGPELRASWKSIIDKGGLEALSPEARKAFCALPFSHQESRDASAALKTPEGQASTIRDWIIFFQENYRKAAAE
ncbi:MAG: ABC transporter substrate-binding protein, partial [Victivallales bacterium]|nr:ABC transporter substrate-binding protein [Victivallales bacterium]